MRATFLAHVEIKPSCAHWSPRYSSSCVLRPYAVPWEVSRWISPRWNLSCINSQIQDSSQHIYLSFFDFQDVGELAHVGPHCMCVHGRARARERATAWHNHVTCHSCCHRQRPGPCASVDVQCEPKTRTFDTVENQFTKSRTPHIASWAPR